MAKKSKNVVELTLGKTPVEVPVKAEKKSRTAKSKATTATKPATKTSRKKAAKPEAETKVVEQVAETTQVVEAPKPAEPPKPLSLKDRLLAKRESKEAFDGAALSGRIQEYKEVSREPSLMADFASYIEQADEAGIADFSFALHPKAAQNKWFGLSLTEVVGELRRLAKVDGEVAKLLTALQDFLANNMVGEKFWRVVQEVARPFAAVNDRGELQKELNRLVSTNLVELNGRYDDEAIVLHFGPTRFVYGRKREFNPVSQKREPALVVLIGWQFAKKAAEKIKDQFRVRRGELKALQDEATLTPKEALAKKNGTFYIQPGKSSGLLLEILDGKVRVLKAIDVRVGSNLPTKWVAWDASPNSWPSQDTAFAFKTWREKAEAAAAAAK